MLKRKPFKLGASFKKMIEENLIKPKTKIGLGFFLSALYKWRNDLLVKKISHIKLMQFVLDESGYSAMLKNKKDIDNENRLENIKELLSAMKEFDNLEGFLEHADRLSRPAAKAGPMSCPAGNFSRRPKYKPIKPTTSVSKRF